MTEDRLVSLIVKELSGELSPEGLNELEKWSKEDPKNQELISLITNSQALEAELSLFTQIDPRAGYANWISQTSDRKRRRIRMVIGSLAAACLLLAVAVNFLVQRRDSAIVQAPAKHLSIPAIMPGRNTATLTLDNGERILLDSVGSGQLARQGGSRVLKTDNGKLRYEAKGVDGAIAYNLLTTPKSGQYSITLADGSRVWLNNLSSLRYPTAFDGKDRVVELTGEAYFEVAKDRSRPFVVKVRDAQVEVLGTSFNVMAYSDEESTQTTLLTGSVRVKAADAIAILKPDEQAQVTKGKLKLLEDMPVEDIVAWKNGFFYFGREVSFSAMMRQLARWYDVEIVYQGGVPDFEFSGKIDRSLPLNDVLQFLSKNQIHLRLEGRKLIVQPS